MTELLTPPHPQPVAYINQAPAQQQTFVTDTNQHPVDLSNSRPPPPLLSSPAAHTVAAFYGLEYRDRRADTYKPNGLSLSLGITDSGKYNNHPINFIVGVPILEEQQTHAAYASCLSLEWQFCMCTL